MKISPTTVQNPVDNLRASSAKQAGKPHDDLVSKFDPTRSEPATRVEVLSLVGVAIIAVAVVGFVGWFVGKAL